MIFTKLTLDQFLITPPLLARFYVCMSWMEGKKDLVKECREKLVPTFQASCLFWLPAQALNFLLVPQAMRVVYVGTCSLMWVNVLCVIKRNDK